MRCERSVGWSAGASCSTASCWYVPSVPSSDSGRNVLQPAVSSHSFDQRVRSRPDVSSSSTSRSARVVFPQACLAKYARRPAMNSSSADPRDELAQHGGALGVGDAVEVGLHRLDVRGVRDDRVGRGQLVLAVAPGLASRREGRPRRAEPGGLGGRVVGHELGERLVEPQVVPPPHGHQVAEPHVRHLVEQRVGAGVAQRVGDLAAEDEVVLVERDAAGVLHGAGVELGDADLVVLGERVGQAELLLEEREPLLGQLDQLGRVEVLPERGAAVRGPAGSSEPSGRTYSSVTPWNAPAQMTVM